MYNPNNSILLLGRHLVVARQAKAAAEDICANVSAGTRYVGVAAGTSVALSGDERKLPEKRL